MLKKHKFTILFLSWVIFITALSLFSFSELELDEGFEIPHFDKITHFIFYFVFVILAFFSWQERKNESIRGSKTAVILFISAVIYGVIIEVLQYSMPFERMGELWDVLANSLGALCGAWLTKKKLSLNGVLK